MAAVPKLCWTFPSCPCCIPHCQDRWMVYIQLLPHRASPSTTALLPPELACLHCASCLQTLTPFLIHDHSLICTVHLRSGLLVHPKMCLPSSSGSQMSSSWGGGDSQCHKFVPLNNTLSTQFKVPCNGVNKYSLNDYCVQGLYIKFISTMNALLSLFYK